MSKYRIAYGAAFLVNLGVLIASNSRLCYIFGAALLILPLISGLHLLLFMRSISVDCAVDDHTEAGRELSANVRIFTPLRIIPGDVFFLNRIGNKMFSLENRRTVFVKLLRGENNISLPVESLLCGEVEFVIEDLQCYDILHLFKKRKKLLYKAEISVYPREAAISAVFKKSFSVEREGRIYDIYRKGSDASEILDLRKYQQGDSVKNIHWKLTSKLGYPVIREYSRPSNLNTLIFCDVSLGQGDNEILGHSLAIAVAVSRSMTEQGIGHSLCFMDAETCKITGIESMKEHAKMVNEMITLRLDPSPFDAAQAFLSLDLGGSFSKIIYIARSYNAEAVKIMADRADLTLIVANTSGKNFFESRDGCDIVSLSADGLYSGVHSIRL